MYGVLSANITFIGLFICTLIISVIFYRLNENAPSNATPEKEIKDFTFCLLFFRQPFWDPENKKSSRKIGEDGINKIFSNLFEKNGMIAGVTVYSAASKANIDQKQHEHFIQRGDIDFSVIFTPDFNEIKNEQKPARIITVNHNDLPKLHLKLNNLLTLR